MKIILDTNIIFSSLVNSNSVISDILLSSKNIFDFYSCNYMRFELKENWNKLLKYSKLTNEQLKESEFRIFKKINFISEELISEKIWIESEEICKDIDVDDSDFVALTKYLKSYLWTGDKELYSGLKKKNFNHVLNTSEIIEIRKSLM